MAREEKLGKLRRWSLVLVFMPLLLASCTSLSQASPGVTSDPVCGAVVNRRKAVRKVYGGRDYYFDSEKCAEEFETHPSSYAMVHLSRVGPR